MEHPPSLYKSVHRALSAWHSSSNKSGTLLEELDSVDPERSDPHRSPVDRRLAVNRALERALAELALKNERGAAILRLRFQDEQMLHEVGHAFNLSPHSISRLQERAIHQLAGILWAAEGAYRRERTRRLKERLPAPPEKLFGFAEAERELVQRLAAEEGAGIVAITGLGGIGKTSLAIQVMHRLIDRQLFEKVIWLVVEPQRASGAGPRQLVDLLTAEMVKAFGEEPAGPLLPDQRRHFLQQQFRQQPTLVVVDNLETPTDLSVLLNHLERWARHSRFLLTSRANPIGLSDVACYPLSQLSPADAANLIRHQAEKSGLADLVTAADPELEPIYQVTGGNPLTLKMVISLAAVMPLSRILADLRGRRPGRVRDMYEDIFDQAWQALTAPARQLLGVTPLIAEGGATADYLQQISGLDDQRFWAALTELLNRSLLDVRGTSWERLYGIHHLTRSYIQSRSGWPAAHGEEE